MLRLLPALCALLWTAVAADLPLAARVRLAGAWAVAVMQAPQEQEEAPVPPGRAAPKRREPAAAAKPEPRSLAPLLPSGPIRAGPAA
jgi:hypothetical protein